MVNQCIYDAVMTLSHQVPLAPVLFYQSLEPPEGNKRVRLSYPLWGKNAVSPSLHLVDYREHCGGGKMGEFIDSRCWKVM